MKNLSFILCCLSILCGLACPFLAIGTVHACEQDIISGLQFWVQELIALSVGGLSWLFYKVGKYFYNYYNN